eukprot:g9257.t1
MCHPYGKSYGLKNSECSGPCKASYYCPLASVKENAAPCGSTNLFCPMGSARPLTVHSGYYTAGGNENQRSKEIKCELGFWCDNLGQRHECAAGRYGAASGLNNSNCTGICSPGFYCPPKSIDPRQKECSGVPTNVKYGYYTIGGNETTNKTRVSETICETGYFCERGMKFRCPPGRYGRTKGLTTEFCTGYCPAGYMCEWNTTTPLACKPGYYSSGGWSNCSRCGSLANPRDSRTESTSTCKTGRKCCNM